MTIEALCKPFYSINNGPKIDPWGTAQVIYEYEFLFLFCTMFCFLWARWLSSHNKLLPLTLYASSFSVKIPSVYSVQCFWKMKYTNKILIAHQTICYLIYQLNNCMVSGVTSPKTKLREKMYYVWYIFSNICIAYCT